MHDACSGRDLLLSLRFAGIGLDCVVRRRVNDLGLRRQVRGCRAGLHSKRITQSYVLASVAYWKPTAASRAGLTIVPWHGAPGGEGPRGQLLIFLHYKSNVRQKELITASSEIK